MTSIIADEMNIAGSGSWFECFYKGKALQTRTGRSDDGDPALTMTWMKLCYDLLRLTRNPLYADQYRAKRLQRAGRLDEGGRLANSQVQPARRRGGRPAPSSAACT